METIVVDEQANRPGKWCYVLTVHGTWGRGIFPSDPPIRNAFGAFIHKNIRWFDVESIFCQRLADTLRQDGFRTFFSSFTWSGENSIYSRDTAARELVAVISNILIDRPDDLLLIVCHSHGGNVALRALELGNINSERIGVVTLSTPFLRVYKKLDGSFYMIKMLFPISLFSFMMINLRHIVPVDNISAQFIFYYSWFCIAISVPVSIFILKYMLGITQDEKWLRHSTEISAAAYYDTRRIDATRILVIRGIDDEAGYALTFGAMGARLSSLLLTDLAPFLVLRNLLIILSVFITVGYIDVSRCFFILYILGCFVWLVVLTCVFKSFLGREFVVGSMTCEVAVDSSPDTTGRVDIVTLKRVRDGALYPESALEGLIRRTFEALVRTTSDTKFDQENVSGLRHATYNDARVPREIANWVGRIIGHQEKTESDIDIHSSTTLAV
jgi:hypothetical protein